MRVHFTNAGTVTLSEPRVFNRLDVLVDPQSPDRLAQAIARVGRPDGPEHVRLCPAILRFLSGHAGEPEWEAGFAAMLDYAGRKGWLDEAGHVRAHLSHREDDTTISEADFKQAMRALPAGICAITSGSGTEAVGMIVSSLTSISADPPLIGFFAHHQSSVRPRLLACGRFAANVLGDKHRDVMAAFLSESQGPDRFKKGQWQDGALQVPVLQDALASMECEIVCTQSLGTHDLIVGKIRHTRSSPANPVVHFNATTHRLLAEPETPA